MTTYKKQLKDKDGNIIIPVTNTIEDYSLSEVDTGHTWIDGKHIYKKTYYTGLPSGGTTINTSSLSIDRIIKIEAMGFWNGYGGAIPWPYYLSGTDNGRVYWMGSSASSALYIQCTLPDYLNRNIDLTIYYTKA